MIGAPEAKLAWPTSTIREDNSREVPLITVPTLVLAGSQDQVDSVEQHRREVTSRIPGSRLQIISVRGHLMPFDEPLALANAIDIFVAKHARGLAGHHKQR